MSDPIESPDPSARRRARIRAELVRRGLTPAHAETLAKGLSDLVAVIGAEACAAAFDAALDRTSASPAASKPDAAAAPATASHAVAQTEQILGNFLGELGRLDDALKQLARHLADMRGRASRKTPPADDEPGGPKTLH